MKKIFFGKKNPSDKTPFWMPWGFGGWLGRVIGFLLLLGALILILSMFHHCCRTDGSADDSDETAETRLPADLIDHPDFTPEPIADTEPVNPGRMSDPGPFLPDDDHNRIRPIDDDDIIDHPDEPGRLVADRLNVILNSDAGDDTFRQFASEFKRLYPSDEYAISYYNTYTKMLQLQVPPEKREAVKRNLPSQIPDIDFKVFDDMMFTSLAEDAPLPNDKIFNYPAFNWFYKVIRAPQAWKITMGSPEVTIAIVDSYFDLDHPDLNGDRIVKPYSVRFGTSDVSPASDCPEKDPAHPDRAYAPFEHGSMVASQALGTADNVAAMCGIAPKCKFMPVSLGHQFTTFTILNGLLYAINQGADVVNLSVGMVFPDEVRYLSTGEQLELSGQLGLSQEEIWDYVFKLADERNATIVWAAGNDSVFTALEPNKRNENTVRVAAVDRDLKPAEFTNWGTIPDLGIHETTVSAPGVDILGAAPYSTYDSGPGTSFASPLVAGAVGLMKSVNPNLTNAQVVKILTETGKPLGDDSLIGPLLQADKAVKAAKSLRTR